MALFPTPRVCSRWLVLIDPSTAVVQRIIVRIAVEVIGNFKVRTW